MSIKLKCLCGAKYTLETSIAGRKARCKKCGRVIRVPSLMESDAMGKLRALPAYEGPHRSALYKKLQETATTGTDGRLYLKDPAHETGSLAVMRAQDLATHIASRGTFQRNEDGRREMIFFTRTGPQTVKFTLETEVELNFDYGIIAPTDDTENCWHYYKVDPNLYLAVAIGSAAADSARSQDEEDVVEI